jgi:hypothetical protein
MIVKEVEAEKIGRYAARPGLNTFPRRACPLQIIAKTIRFAEFHKLLPKYSADCKNSEARCSPATAVNSSLPIFI